MPPLPPQSSTTTQRCDCVLPRLDFFERALILATFYTSWPYPPQTPLICWTAGFSMSWGPESHSACKFGAWEKGSWVLWICCSHASFGRSSWVASQSGNPKMGCGFPLPQPQGRQLHQPFVRMFQSFKLTASCELLPVLGCQTWELEGKTGEFLTRKLISSVSETFASDCLQKLGFSLLTHDL